MSSCEKIAAGLAVAACLLGPPASAQADLLTIDPRATYLRTNGDVALDAVAIDLFALSFPVSHGDTLVLERVGDYSPFPAFGDLNRSMVGVFSSSATLLASSIPNRVAGAIDAGSDFTTSPTGSGGLATDIPQDFLISDPTGGVSSVLIQVPVGAGFLFLTTHDSFFGDNTDANGNYAVRITPAAQVPGSLPLIGIVALAAVVARGPRRGAVEKVR